MQGKNLKENCKEQQMEQNELNNDGFILKSIGNQNNLHLLKDKLNKEIIYDEDQENDTGGDFIDYKENNFDIEKLSRLFNILI